MKNEMETGFGYSWDGMQWLYRHLDPPTTLCKVLCTHSWGPYGSKTPESLHSTGPVCMWGFSSNHFDTGP